MKKEERAFSPEKNSKGVYVAILNQGNVRTELSYFVTEITHQHKYRLYLTYPAAKPIANNRNQIIQDFLSKPEYDYLMMVDSDIVPPHNYLDLVDFDKDIISGVCFAYADNSIIPLVLRHLTPEEIAKADQENPQERSRPYRVMPFDGDEGLIECDAVGSGAMIMKREVVEALKDEQPFCNIYDEQGIKTLGLDLSFCKKAKEKGFRVWTHLDYISSHWVVVDLKTFYRAMIESREVRQLQVKDTPNEKIENIHGTR